MADSRMPASDGDPIPQAAARPVRSSSALRRAVPLLLLVLIIGGIAWLVQNMPTWRSGKKETASAPKGQQPILDFLHYTGMALWEIPEEAKGDKGKSEAAKDDKQEPPPPYQREFEQGAEGHYFFPFKVNADQAAQMGLGFKSCDCAWLHVAFLPREAWEKLIKETIHDPGGEPADADAWTWQALDKNDKQGIAVPAGSLGVLRMSWKNRRPPGQSLNLGIRLWATQGAAKRQEYAFGVPAQSTTALRVNKDHIDLGVLSQGAGTGPSQSSAKAEFLFWSPTRDQAELKLSDKDALDPLFGVAITPLGADERAGLQSKLRREKVNTRVRSAWRVAVSVFEQKDAHQLGQGHLRRALSLQIPDAAEELAPIVLTGLVRGPVEIGGVEDQGKINLKSLAAKDGARKTTYLWAADSTTELKVASWHPAGIQVTLKETANKEGARKKWALEVEVPPNQLFGPIPDEADVILQFRAKDMPARTIRIPLLGHAVQG